MAASSSAIASAAIPAGQTAALRLTYRSQGLESWRYRFGADPSPVRDFRLDVDTNFKQIDFPDGYGITPLMAAAHGGQILLSETTRSLLEDEEEELDGVARVAGQRDEVAPGKAGPASGKDAFVFPVQGG